VSPDAQRLRRIVRLCSAYTRAQHIAWDSMVSMDTRKVDSHTYALDPRVPFRRASGSSMWLERLNMNTLHTQAATSPPKPPRSRNPDGTI
jgi:hypothetical protein